MRLALFGFGHVGRALARLLLATRDRHAFTVTAIVTARHGAVVDKRGVDLAAALTRERLGDDAAPIGKLPADVLVEMTTLDARTGEPALTYIREALGARLHVVTSNKGPLAVAVRELPARARATRRPLRSAATAPACPQV